MTNILASIVVTILTNSTETVPHYMVPEAAPSREGSFTTDALYRGRAVPHADPKEKWITTAISEVTVVRFELSGRQFEAKSERTLTNWTEHFLLVPALPPTQQWTRNTNNVPIPLTWFGR